MMQGQKNIRVYFNINKLQGVYSFFNNV